MRRLFPRHSSPLQAVHFLVQGIPYTWIDCITEFCRTYQHAKSFLGGGMHEGFPLQDNYSEHMDDSSSICTEWLSCSGNFSCIPPPSKKHTMLGMLIWYDCSSCRTIHMQSWGTCHIKIMYRIVIFQLYSYVCIYKFSTTALEHADFFHYVSYSPEFPKSFRQ